MQVLRTLSAAVLLAIAAASTTQYVTASPMQDVEPQPVPVTSYNTAIVATALADKRNYASTVGRPICLTEVTRVRQAVYNQTRELYFEVNGCAVTKAQGLCKKPSACVSVTPFEVHVTGPESTPRFDPIVTLFKGKPVKTPYVVESIGSLL